ncbi:COP9 signalosome complex subunit 10 [Bienertia sinuspersici]
MSPEVEEDNSHQNEIEETSDENGTAEESETKEVIEDLQPDPQQTVEVPRRSERTKKCPVWMRDYVTDRNNQIELDQAINIAELV